MENIHRPPLKLNIIDQKQFHKSESSVHKTGYTSCGDELVVKAVESGHAFVVKSHGVGPAPATVSRQMH